MSALKKESIKVKKIPEPEAGGRKFIFTPENSEFRSE
jgi:hypothetical protein